MHLALSLHTVPAEVAYEAAFESAMVELAAANLCSMQGQGLSLPPTLSPSSPSSLFAGAAQRLWQLQLDLGGMQLQPGSRLAELRSKALLRLASLVETVRL